jgi:hypothetical protein
MATAATNRMVNTTAQTSAGSGPLCVMVCHRRYSRRQLLASAAIAASRVTVLFEARLHVA